MSTYIILTDDRKTRGTFTKWAEVEKNNLCFLSQLIDYFKKSNNPEAFILFDTENKTAHRLIDCKIIGGRGYGK